MFDVISASKVSLFDSTSSFMAATGRCMVVTGSIFVNDIVTPLNDLLNLRATQKWSIWFLVMLFGNRQVAL